MADRLCGCFLRAVVALFSLPASSASDVFSVPEKTRARHASVMPRRQAVPAESQRARREPPGDSVSADGHVGLEEHEDVGQATTRAETTAVLMH